MIIALLSYIIGSYYFGVPASEEKVNLEEVRSDGGKALADKIPRTHPGSMTFRSYRHRRRNSC